MCFLWSIHACCPGCGEKKRMVVSRRLCLPAHNDGTRTVVQYLPSSERNQTMQHKAHQHLEAQLRRIEQQRHIAKQKLRALARETRREQRARHGEYVEVAGLAQLDPGTLLGGLCELATLLTDAERVARWKVRGDATLEVYRWRKAHRRRRASSLDGGISAPKTQGTQA
jgi:Conjugal transfer protein TraD